MDVQSMGHREESKMFKNNPKVEDVVKKSETEKTINLKFLKANSQQHWLILIMKQWIIKSQKH